MSETVTMELTVTQTCGLALAAFLGRLYEIVFFQTYFPKTLKNILKHMPKY